jgi:hypothetical protein
MKEMKFSNADEIRISILMALIIGETVGLLHFYGQPTFSQFIILSLAGITLTIPLLWLEWIQRRGVSYFGIFFAIWCYAAMTAWWNEGGQFERMFDRVLIVGLPIWIMVKVLRKLLRPLDLDQQEAFLITNRAEDKRIGRIARNTVGLIACLLLSLGMVSGRASALWTIPLSLPVIWFTWRIIFHLFYDQQISVDEKVRSDVVTDSGGRA